MEIPVIESVMDQFQSPSILLHLRTLWTWGALILAALAAFNSLIRRPKRVILKFRRVRSVIHLQSSSTCCSYSSSSSSDDDVSCSSSDDENEDREEVGCSDFEEEFEDFVETQGQNGKSDHDHDLFGSVVRLWEGPDVKRDDESMRPLVWGGLDAIPETLRVWDARAPSAAWRADGLGRLVGIGRGNENVVCFGHDGTGKLTVVDLRNVKSPLAEIWWCGDGRWQWARFAV